MPFVLPPRQILGRYPSEVSLLSEDPHTRSRLWLKNDGYLSAIYGGNKVRKLEFLLADAQQRGAQRLFTVGALGSHHVLATALFGKQSGLHTRAILVPQLKTPHVEATYRASIAAGVSVIEASSQTAAFFSLARRLQHEDYFIPPGGSSVLGSVGYFCALVELAQQVQSGQLKEPDQIVVPLGSGGTAAGLLAGLAYTGLRSRLIAVDVGALGALADPCVLVLAGRVLQRLGLPLRWGFLRSRLVVERRFAGRGYGMPTEAAKQAQKWANAQGLRLELTYTAKACAKALELLAQSSDQDILYWHTFSQVEPAQRCSSSARVVDVG